MANKLLLLGDEAIALGALDAGLSGIYAYPGTPSTEITEYVQHSKTAKENKVHCSWSSNEKTAMEAALGMSYAGKRAMVCMKHVGLNVAADPFINSAITGANGGLIVVSADDPSMHSSQNEQDSRFYGKFAMVPILEPSSQQEAYDMVHYGFNFSEKYKIPVLLRITTRMAHSRSGVVRGGESGGGRARGAPEVVDLPPSGSDAPLSAAKRTARGAGATRSDLALDSSGEKRVEIPALRRERGEEGAKPLAIGVVERAGGAIRPVWRSARGAWPLLGTRSSRHLWGSTRQIGSGLRGRGRGPALARAAGRGSARG